MENKNEIILAVAVFLGVLTAGGGYFLLQTSTDDVPKNTATLSSSSGEGGIVAVLGQSQQPAAESSAQQNTEEIQEPAPEPVAETVLSDKPYTLDLPSGWKQVDSETDADPCEEGSETKIDTYKNGTQTLVVYENGHPGGCSRDAIADVYLDYNYTAANDSVKVDTSEITQCSKEDNPDCPKGDGQISLFVGNESNEDPDKLNKNIITGKTYFFSVTETNGSGDLAAQKAKVKKMAELVETIKFK